MNFSLILFKVIPKSKYRRVKIFHSLHWYTIVDPRESDKTAFAQAQQRQSMTQPIINTVTQTVQLFDNSKIPIWDSSIFALWLYYTIYLNAIFMLQATFLVSKYLHRYLFSFVSWSEFFFRWNNYFGRSLCSCSQFSSYGDTLLDVP